MASSTTTKVPYKVDVTGFKLVPATPEQDLEATKREWTEWGHPHLTLDQFIQREKEVLAPTDFSATRRQRWVLVPDNDADADADDETDDFLAACETYRRPIMLANPDQPGEVRRAISYSVCSVFVPKEKRMFGYASKMMTLLQHALNPAAETPEDYTRGQVANSQALVLPLGADHGEGKRHGGDATCSYLYSDVGEYYSTFGWRVVGNRHVEWPASVSTDAQQASLPATARWLKPEELYEIGRLDREYLRVQLLSRPSSAVRFAVDDPEATSWRWLIKRSSFYASILIPADQPHPEFFGLLLPGDEPSYAVWMLDLVNRKISVLRLRFSSIETLQQLVSALQSQAAKFGLEKVMAWNVDLPSLGVQLSQDDEAKLSQGVKLDQYRQQLAGGDVAERSGRSASLPALAYYGDRKLNQPVEWVCNEYGWWC
ncbi:hypothetical protein BCV70DRAFT_203291 [Testicularia cyperi]|uniref:LYC1 C-terminal domain-containing protein n=1 Tax=Testicularia cyperi TaxID=1882483 RepID=A0A317XER8_9BASI|nr:hypothetical protein BCV70DRAFT_203291 [Testicularia cyperi]